MSWFAIYALFWPGIVAGAMIGFAYFLAWLEDRAERRRHANSAE